jgi:type I restriction-modification system DNA methylase subunit
MIINMASKQELSVSITNKNALKDKIHEIHNFIRNSGAGYGTTALKIFNLIYGLKRIEEFNLIDKLNLKRPECEFSHLIKIAKSDDVKKDEIILELLTNDILNNINKSSIRHILFYEIPTNIKGSIYTQLILEVDIISKIEKTSNVLLSGKVYEYFIGRDRSAISELGAYFTDRHITNFIFNKIKIDKFGTFIDPFAGSGGFTVEYMNYINSNYPKINWTTEINNIYHYDINDDVIKSAGLEFFCLSNGNIVPIDNLKVENSFKNDFSNRKFNYVISNPPYGGDKVIKNQEQLKRDKIKNYIKELLKQETDNDIKAKRNKQLKEIEELNKFDKIRSDKLQVNKDSCSKRIKAFCKEYCLDAKDKEACSLILLMDLLESDGICCGVLKEGVFFDSKYSKIRKVLIDKYNVTDIISVPADQFENTTTKTSIIIFKNTEEKTTEIIFSELIVNKFQDDKFEEDEEGNIIISEYKDDIYSIDNPIISTVSVDEIKEKSYSLNYKDYDKKELICGNDYKLVKLGDICEINNKSKRLASFQNEFGKYNYYSSGNKILKCDEADFNDNLYIIIGHSGNGCLFLDNLFSTLITNHVLYGKNKYITKYIYLYLKYFYNQFYNKCYKGSTVKNTSNQEILNYIIAIPKTEDKLNEIVNKISIPFDRKKENEDKLKELKETIKNKIIHITENEECEEVELGSICDLKDGYDFYRDEMDNRKYYIEGENLPLLKINSNEITDYIKINDKYKHFIVNKGDLIIGTKGSCGKIRKNNIKQAYYKHGLLKFINIKVNNDYLYNLLQILLDDNLINNLTTKSVLSNLKKSNLQQLKIKIPKDKSLITALEPLFNEVDELEELIENDEKIFKEYLEELAKDAIISNDTPKINNYEIDEVEEVDEKQSIEKELSEMTIQELKNKCKELNIKGYSKLKKEELIEAIHKN